MSTRSIKQAVERAQREDAKAEASVLRQQRKLQEAKVTARKKTTRIKIVLGADVLALKQGRISGDEFERRADRGVAELQEINESLARIGFRIVTDQVGGNSELLTLPAPVSPPLSTSAAPKSKKPIVRFWEPPPGEFRQRLRPEFGLTYDPDTWTWWDLVGGVDPATVEEAIRAAGLWGLVREFHR